MIRNPYRTTLLLLVTWAASSSAPAITVPSLGPRGQGGDLHGFPVAIGAGGTVHEMDSYLHLGDGPSLRLSSDPLPAGLTLGFTWELAADGSWLALRYALTNTSQDALPPALFLTYLDAEIDENQNGFTNEYALVTGEPGTGAGDETPDAFEVDEPGFAFGNLQEHLYSGALDNLNAVAAGVPECVAMSLAFELGEIGPGETALIEVQIAESDASLGGLTITQRDSGANSMTFITYSARGRVTSGVPADGFRRGDYDGDGALERSDADAILGRLFDSGAAALDCFGNASASSADANDNEHLTVADFIAVRDALDRGTQLPDPASICDADPDDSQRGFDEFDPAYRINAGDPRIEPPTGGVNRRALIPVLIDTPRPLTALTVILSFDPTTLTPLTGANGEPPLFTSELGTVRTIVDAAAGHIVITMWARNAGEILLAGAPGTFQAIGTVGFKILDFAILRPFAWLEEVPAGTVTLRSTLVDDLAQDHHPSPTAGEFQFVRGNSNNDGAVNISDPIFTLSYLFLGGADPVCLDAVDADNDSKLNITDPVFTLNFLFIGGRPIPQPYPQCGVDVGPAVDLLGCSPCACPPYPQGDPCLAP